AELDGDGDIVSVFVYATRPNVPDLMYSCKDPAAPVAPCDPGAPWRAYRVVSDHLGSVRLVVSLDDATFGEVVQRTDYDEYGVVLTDTAPGFQPFGFAGGVYDVVTSITRFGVRDYEPFIAKWFNKDQFLFIIGALSTYIYSNNDPVNKFDLFGLQQYYPLKPSGVTIFSFAGFEFKLTFTPAYEPIDPSAMSGWRENKYMNFLSDMPCYNDPKKIPAIYTPFKLPELKLGNIKESLNKYFTSLKTIDISFPDLTLKGKL
ncbi:MAG: hypothetical protein DRI34_05680, partial [Deltaproteobacteria bacterium]